MSIEYYDFVIIGGGMSGLSLTKEIISSGLTKNKKLLIIEKRDNYYRDKIWSFWNIMDSNYQKIKFNSWSSFLFLILLNQYHLKILMNTSLLTLIYFI